MSVFINKDIRVIVQGIIGFIVLFYIKQMLEYGMNIVGGVIFGKGGIEVEGVLVFNMVVEVVYIMGVDVLVIYVLVLFVVDVIMEVVDVEIDFVICIIEYILVLDMVKVKCFMEGKKMRLIGLNCLGVIMFEECKIGIMLGYIYKKGYVGVVFCLGILIYEVVYQFLEVGVG